MKDWPETIEGRGDHVVVHARRYGSWTDLPGRIFQGSALTTMFSALACAVLFTGLDAMGWVPWAGGVTVALGMVGGLALVALILGSGVLAWVEHAARGPILVRLHPTELQIGGRRWPLARLQSLDWSDSNELRLTFEGGRTETFDAHTGDDAQQVFQDLVNDRLRGRGTRDEVPQSIQALREQQANDSQNGVRPIGVRTRGDS